MPTKASSCRSVMGAGFLRAGNKRVVLLKKSIAANQSRRENRSTRSTCFTVRNVSIVTCRWAQAENIQTIVIVIEFDFSADTCRFKARPCPSPDPAFENGYLTLYRVGQGKARRERRRTPPSLKVGPEKSEVSTTSLSIDLKGSGEYPYLHIRGKISYCGCLFVIFTRCRVPEPFEEVTAPIAYLITIFGHNRHLS